VQTFYQPFFTHSFPFSNFPLAILFSSLILFHSKSFPHQKAQSKRIKPKPKPNAKSKKAPSPPSVGLSGKQGGAEALGEESDIVTRETCISASLKASLGDAAVLHFSVCGQGCAYLSLQMKAIKLHLTLLTSSSHRLFIIHSPQ
jgi:hypothetical protein